MASKPQVNLSSLNRWMNQVVQPHLMRTAQQIAEEARVKAPRGATGELSQSITIQKGSRGAVIIKVNAPHAGFVHQGTGPQHTPGARAPYYPALRKRGVLLWAATKGLNPYAVAHGISQHGTPPNPFFEEAIVKVLGKHRFRWIRRDEA